MYLTNSSYSIIHLYLQELEKELKLGNSISTECLSYDQKNNNMIKFKCFNFKSNIKFDSIFIKKLKYYGMLEFEFNISTNELFIKKVPYITFNNSNIPLFTNDLAKIIIKLLNNYVSNDNLKIVFANPCTILVIDSEVQTIIPDVVNTNNYHFLQIILNKINNEIEKINNNCKKNHDRLVKENLKKEYALIKRRKICGIDSESFDNVEEFYLEVNKRLCELWTKKLNKINRHLNATKIKYKNLILDAKKELLEEYFESKFNIDINNLTREEMDKYLEKQLNSDLKELYEKIQELKQDYLFEFKTCNTYWFREDIKYREGLKYNKYYQRFAEWLISNVKHPIFSCEKSYNGEIIYDRKNFIIAINYLEQIAYLQKKISEYKNLLNHPNDAILNFTANSNYWNAIMQFPYWLKLEKDKFQASKEEFFLLMIKQGVTHINLDKIRKFSRDKDKKRKISISDEYKCSRLMITIPKSLSYLEIIKLVKYAFKHSNSKNFICENSDVASKVKTICANLFFDSNDYWRYYVNCDGSESRYMWWDSDFDCMYYSDNQIFINIDPDYYRNYFLSSPSNKVLWHKYDYSSCYRYHRYEPLAFDSKIIYALISFFKHNIKPTNDMVLELILGNYSNIERFSEVRKTYNEIIDSLNNKIVKEFEKEFSYKYLDESAKFCEKNYEFKKKLERDNSYRF